MKSVDYYFCLNSPWSLFASKQLAELLPTLDIQLNLKPLNIWELFTATNFPVVSERPQYMLDYRLLELNRWSKRLSIPLNTKPAHVPVDEVGATALILSAQQEKGIGFEVATTLANDLWVDNKNIADAGFLVEQAERLEISSLMSHEQCAEIMSANTKELLSLGGFGVPTFVVDGELIWGQDRISFLVEAVS